jgi:formylglycine-generating enzyme required for sulfatase activity
LRSFDAGDADFFLDLLPGPRDRDGLPESLVFWKTRLEEIDPDKTFPVGLLFGPSGCGKSSLVKAGLLPWLADQVLAVYVEATPGETEARLLKGLRKRCSSLDSNLGLVDCLAGLRRGHGLLTGQKVLLVLDQFEQWLHARQQDANTELMQALRQCDGGRVQALLLVRDDFGMATARFLRELEVRIVEGHNFATVDLFDPAHARKVLALFGRAFGCLAEGSTAEQESFLNLAVAGLAQEGRVIPVRLALFADMVKARPWVPAALRDVGGAEGVGVAFLDEVLGQRARNPEYRLHARAAQAVLQALLPEAGADLKGHMRQGQELLEASGYAQRPRDFEDLLRILDSELRLITPTDPSGMEGERWRVEGKVDAATRYYQLTHDYLVPSLREWLTRKQRETRRGRAELRLAERAAQWNLRPEGRFLPAWWEWLIIRLITRSTDWTGPQRRMMARAGRYHVTRGAALAVLLAALITAGLVFSTHVVEQTRATHAAGLVSRLLDADTAKVPDILDELRDYRLWADPLLRQENHKAAPGSRQQLHTALALLEVDEGQLDLLAQRLLDAQPAELKVLRDTLEPHAALLRQRLWDVAQSPPANQETQRLRAAYALAAYDPDSPNWNRVAAPLVRQLVAQNSVYRGDWLAGFRLVRLHLLPELAEVFRDPSAERAAQRIAATDILADFAADQGALLGMLLLDADATQFAVLLPKAQALGEPCLGPLLAEVEHKPALATEAEKERLAHRQANAGVALLRLGRPESIWDLLEHGPDPRVRSQVLERLSPLSVDPRSLWQRFQEEPRVSVRRALLLGLGEFSDREFPGPDREALFPRLMALYRDDPDPGIHGAAAWLLGQWGQQEALKAVAAELMKRDREAAQGLRPLPGGRRWFLNGQGQTMVQVIGPVEFWMGSAQTEAEREAGPEGRAGMQHYRRIGRSYVLAAHEVTVEQFLRFRKNPAYNEHYSSSPDHPINGVSWSLAAAYCNWLSEKENIPPDQWCYEPASKEKLPSQQMQVYEALHARPGYLSLRGYRLPTEAEWEYACRAWAVTARFHGETDDLLTRYAWYTKNSHDRGMARVGSLRPNDLGLFDMLGNVAEWCHDPVALYPAGAPGKPAMDEEFKDDIGYIKSTQDRILRGGAFTYHARYVRSASRDGNRPSNGIYNFGFRPARTYP